MKKLAISLAAIAAVFALGACTDDEDDPIVVPTPVPSASVSTEASPVPDETVTETVPSASASPSVSVSASASPVKDPCDLLDGQAKRICEGNEPPQDRN